VTTGNICGAAICARFRLDLPYAPVNKPGDLFTDRHLNACGKSDRPVFLRRRGSAAACGRRGLVMRPLALLLEDGPDEVEPAVPDHRHQMAGGDIEVERAPGAPFTAAGQLARPGAVEPVRRRPARTGENVQNLQLEARAHIDVQRKIDAGSTPQPATSVEFIRWVHKEFCQQLPEELLVVWDPKTGRKEKVIPGELRQIMVKVGHHIPPAPTDLPPLLERFAAAYGNEELPKIQRIIGIAASHHRLLWIHPFTDGNGRVTRLYSHAFLKELGIGSSLWSVSRGLARAVDKYKAALQAADEPRHGDLDGRGNLTQAGLVDFYTFFLSSCVDQVVFMESLFELAELQRRMEIWCEEETRADRLPKAAGRCCVKPYSLASLRVAKLRN